MALYFNNRIVPNFLTTLFCVEKKNKNSVTTQQQKQQQQQLAVSTTMLLRPSLFFTRRSTAFVRCFSETSHPDFAKKTKAGAESTSSTNTPSDHLNKQEVLALIKKQVTDNSVLLYMKGTPSRPQCGFSGQVIRILNAVGVDYASVNVLEHQSIREGVKSFSQWPTLPQLFVKGEFVGGCDIVTTMYSDGELVALLKKEKLLE